MTFRPAFALLLGIVFSAPTAHADGAARFADLARQAQQRRPIVRIGLEPAHTVRVGARRGFRVLDPETGKPVWHGNFAAPLTLVAEGGAPGGSGKIYRVQVGAFSDEAAARTELERLESLCKTKGVVRHDPDRSSWRVRIGREDDRLALGPLTERLRAAGVKDFWIAEEPATESAGVSIRLVDASWNSFATGLTRLAFVPTRGDRVEVDDKPYRGVFEVRVNDFGDLRPINWIGLEHYLLGVVPAELGPEVWPEPQALQAQAVAARTYVWRNRGQFADEGFDLCATPRCQVYFGVDVEHPMSDRAVLATRGEVLTWKGEPIDALYTSTCGGHTEDGSVVFADRDRPYLSGVPCRAEGDALASLRGTVRGAQIVPVIDETGRDVTRDWALLRAVGVLGDEHDGPAGGSTDRLVSPMTPDALRTLTTRLARAAGLTPPAGAPGSTENLGMAALALVRDLGWDERASLLVAREDVPALLRDPVAANLPADQRRALAYLAWAEALRPFADGSFHVDRAPSVARLLPVLTGVGEIYRPWDLDEGIVSGMGKSSVRLVRGKGEVRLPLARQPFVFGMTGGRAVPLTELEIWPGDRLRYRRNDAGAIDFLELRAPVKGTSDDRTAAVYSWEVRKTRRQLEASINQRVAVGKLRDLQVLSRGVSGRVAELRVIGSRGDTIVRGFDVRRLLDLRESLTVVEIQRDEKGQILAAVFAGKGWGHGVGLCQVGAYGMALRDSSYREILAHYYRGTTLDTLEGSD